MASIREIVELSDTRAGRSFDLAIQFLIILSLVSYSLETLPDLTPVWRHYLNVFEVVSVIIFTAEYFLRLHVAERKFAFATSFFGVVDILAILPFYWADFEPGSLTPTAGPQEAALERPAPARLAPAPQGVRGLASTSLFSGS